MHDSAARPIHVTRDRFQLVPELARLRAERPVTWITLPTGAGAWLVTRHADIRQVLADHERFGSDGRFITDPTPGGQTAIARAEGFRHGDITQYDPPDHTRLRRMIASSFTARHTKRLVPEVEAIVSATVEAMAKATPPVDLVQRFALPVPSMVICELLGVPNTDRRKFHQRSLVRFDGTRPPAERAAAVAASVAYMATLVAAKRAEPGNGLLDLLIRDHGNELDDRELAGIGDLLLLGGYETTANMLALGSLLFLQNPQHIATLFDTEKLDNMIEELTRYLSVVQTGVPRVARCDSELAGQRMRRGERVLCSLPSGNYDSTFTPDPDSFDPTRKTTGHLAFGHGIHHCLGAPLARVEMRAAFPALFRRIPNLRLAGAADELRFRFNSAVYGLESLPVAW